MKKQRKINNLQIIINLFLFAPFLISAQQINRLYIDMPEILNPVLSQKQRYELLEYVKSGLGDSILNRFNNQAHIIQLDTAHNYIRVKNTASSTFEMFSFENNSEIVVGVIKTVCSPICQSHIKFYDTSWNEYPVKFNFPQAIEWISSDDISDFDKNNLPNILNVSFVSLNYNPENKKIIAQNNSLEYLDAQDREKIEDKILKKNFIYSLQNNVWVKE